MRLVILERMNRGINPGHSHCVKDLEAEGVTIVFTGSYTECLKFKRALNK